MSNTLATLTDLASSAARSLLRLARRLPIVGSRLPSAADEEIWLPESAPVEEPVAATPEPEVVDVTDAPTDTTTGPDLEGLLEGVDGVGPAKRKAILAAYPTKDRLASISAQDLANSVKGVSVDLAQKVLAKVG